jgi:glutamate/tyrosine decarboxylase-like PLP-dependent enzyme
MEKDGEFAIGLSKGRKAALALYEKIDSDERFRTIFPPELDIVVWAPNGSSASQISERTGQIFDAAAQENLHLATFKYPTALLQRNWNDVDLDQQYVTCLRSCLMKPEHLDWVEQIWELLSKAANL